MPTSHPKLLTPIMTKVLDQKPQSVLDIGIGFGKWGALVREYTDIWWWRFFQNEWVVRIDGIEYYEKYKNANWNQYNKIYIGKVQDVLPTLGKYELIIMLEVLEHIHKEPALALLPELMRHTDKLLISYTNTDQFNVRDNKLEDHVSRWEPEEFTHLGNVEVVFEDSDGAVLFITK